MPYSYVRLSAGRETMNDEMQALAFFAGANSLFYGDRLLTTDNPESSKDRQLFKRLGINNEEHVIDDLSDDGLNGDPQTQSVSAGTSENSLFYNAV
jgi:biotin synthase